MTRRLVTLIGLMGLMGGCAGDWAYDGKADALARSRAAAKLDGPLPVYTEVEQGGRVYVFASPKSADNFKQGTWPDSFISKADWGPKGQTVIFEANKFYVEDELIAEWKKRHAPQPS